MKCLHVLVKKDVGAGEFEFGLSLPLINKELFTVNTATSLETKVGREVPIRRQSVLRPAQSCAVIPGLLHDGNKVERI